MSAAANTLFHFTTEYSTLEDILINKFYPSYCRESMHSMAPEECIIVPMISFCDIQLSAIKNIRYGNYGIGLSKEWGIKNQLNPVLYVEKNSLLSKSFLTTMDGMYEPYRNLFLYKVELQQLIELQNSTINLTGKQEIQKKIDAKKIQSKNTLDSINFTLYSVFYTKHYQGDLIRNGEIIKNYTFYDEREWRYVPKFDCALCNLKMTNEEYIIWRGDIKNKKPLITTLNLPFSSHDINYIIVKNKAEVNQMIKTIENCLVSRKLDGERDLLLTKILTYEQISEDF